MGLCSGVAEQWWIALGTYAATEQSRVETCEAFASRALAEGAKVAPEPILATLKEAPDGFRSSMQKDVAAGRPPELEAIAGPILRGGTEHGIDVSATRALVDRIMELE
jgi:ketopantoate reductase